MMTAEQVLNECERRGVSVAPAADGFLDVYGPEADLDALAPMIRDRKRELLALLGAPIPDADPRCRWCDRPTGDARRKCWHCENRPCESCGRRTGSVFLVLCLMCDLGGAAGRPG